MSTKAMGRMYTGNGGPSFGGGGGGFDNPSWLSSLFGQDAVTGGADTPYQGSGGIFGGQSRRLATILEAQRQNQLRGIQADKDFAKLQNELNEHADTLKAQHLKEQSIQETVNKLAERHDVHPSVIMDSASKLNQQMTQGAELQQGAINKARQTPQYDRSALTGEEYRAAGMDPNAVTAAPFGGIATRALPTGGNITASGGTQTQDVFLDQFGMAHTRQENQPGNISMPVDAMQYDQAKNLPRPNPSFPAGSAVANGVNATPSGRMFNIPMGGQSTASSGGQDWTGGVGHIPSGNSTGTNGVSPVPSNDQPAAGIGAISSPGGNTGLMGMLKQVFSRGGTSNPESPDADSQGGNALSNIMGGIPMQAMINPMGAAMSASSSTPALSPNPGMNPSMGGRLNPLSMFSGQQPSPGGMQGMTIPGGVSAPQTGVSAMPSMYPMPSGQPTMGQGIPYSPAPNAQGQNVSPTLMNFQLLMQQMQQDRMNGVLPWENRGF